MNKQAKIGKVMKEFKEGNLKTSAGKKVKSRKQAVAIAMSESEGYAEKADLISQINIDSFQEAEDILKAAGTEELFEKAKHQDGDMHPNGKWVWVSSANGGKGDWRTKGGRTHTKHSAGGNAGSTTDTASTSTQKKPSSQYSPMTIKTTKSDGSVSEVKDYGEVKKFKQNGKDVYSIQFKNNSTHGVFSSAKDAQSVIDDAKSKESKPSPQIVGTTKKITSDKQFLDTFRDASDDVLNNIVSGKIQASDKEKKLAQQILDERKKPKVGDVSKLTAQQKSMVDKVMDKGFLMTNNKYNDKSKIELKKTDKGNWRCYYDGKDIGVTIAGSTITDSAAKKIGWYKEGVESKTTSSDSTEKPKKRPIAVGTNGPEKRNTTKIKFHVDNVSDVMKEIRASEDNIANYLGGDAEITNITYRQFITAKDEDGKTFNGIKITVNYKANSSYRPGKEKKQPQDIIIDSDGFMRNFTTYYPSPSAALKKTYSKPNKYSHLVPSFKDKFEVK